MTLLRKRLILFFVPLFLALPFLNRAYFVDDHFFVEIARWIKDHPKQPYDFPTEGQAPNPAMSKVDVSLRILNPLLHHYYLAFLLKLEGFIPRSSPLANEAGLRFGCVLISCFSALVLFELARRWVKHAFLATLLVLVTPVFWLTSYSLLIDPTMGFFFLLALYAFVRGSEECSIGWSVVSGISMGLALWTKYTAALIVPVTWMWAALSWRRLKMKWMVFLPSLIAAVFLSADLYVTKILYGQSHLIASTTETLIPVGAGKILVLLVFLSGVSIAPLLIWFSVERNDALVAGMFFMGLAAFFTSSFGGFSPSQAVLMALWAVTSAFFLIVLWNVSKTSSASDKFLCGWLLGFLAMMCFVMPWAAARYYVIGVPPLIFGLVRLVETNRPHHVQRFLKGGCAVTFAVGLALAYADYQQAESSRSIVKELQAHNELGGEHNYYFSAAFTMTYLAKEGWKPVGDLTTLQPGDRVITSEVSLPIFWFFRQKVPLRLLATIEVPARFPVRVMDSAAAAGFYASAWGPLPFSFSKGPWERFHLFEIIPAS